MPQCLNCAKPLPPTRSRFCRDSCGNAHRAKLKRQEARAAIPPQPCQQCGQDFTPVKSSNIFCTPACRELSRLKPAAPPPVLSENDQIAFRMVSKGFLPEPGCTAPDGSPAWGVRGLAELFGLDERTFLGMMAKRAPVYSRDPGIPSSWAKWNDVAGLGD